jgi:acetyl esterase/lipase
MNTGKKIFFGVMVIGLCISCSGTVEEKTRRGLKTTRFMQGIMKPSFTNKMLEKQVKQFQFTDGTTRESIIADCVPCEWIIPQEVTTNGVLLFIHGGGFTIGLTPQHLQMTATLAGKMKTKALMIDYRLAPQHPFPAALEDCVTVYQWILSQGISPEDIVIAGDSAGGNLTITTLMKLRDMNIPLPAAAAPISPVVNLIPEANHIEGYRDPLLPPKSVNFYNASYVGNEDPKNPLISPLFGNFSGLPPLLVHIAEDEVLRDNAVQFCIAAQEAGANLTYVVYPRMWHVWQLYEKLPQTDQSLTEIANFLVSHLHR